MRFVIILVAIALLDIATALGKKNDDEMFKRLALISVIALAFDVIEFLSQLTP